MLVELVDDPGTLNGAIGLGVGRVNRVSRNRPATGGHGLGRDGDCGEIPSPQISAKTAAGNGEEAGADNYYGSVASPIAE